MSVGSWEVPPLTNLSGLKKPGGSPKELLKRGISTVGELWKLWESSGRGVGALGELWEVWGVLGEAWEW